MTKTNQTASVAYGGSAARPRRNNDVISILTNYLAASLAPHISLARNRGAISYHGASAAHQHRRINKHQRHLCWQHETRIVAPRCGYRKHAVAYRSHMQRAARIGVAA